MAESSVDPIHRDRPAWTVGRVALVALGVVFFVATGTSGFGWWLL